MKKSPIPALIPLALAAFAASIALMLLVRPVWFGVGVCGIGVLALIVGIILLSSYSRSMQAALDDIFKQNASVSAQIIAAINIPAVLFDNNGRIIWTNNAFSSLYTGKDIRTLIPNLDTRNPTQAQSFEHGGRTFQLMSMPVQRAHSRARPLTFQYWIDRTEAIHYSRLYEEQLPTVALIYVDNYDELNADKQFQRNFVLGEVEKHVGEFAASVAGMFRRYDNTRFLVMFEARMLPELERLRFPLLEAVRTIETGTEQKVTLSIAVGNEDRMLLSDESARQGMELALGRGGDQAVVKRGTSYSFYGGKHQVMAKQSRVKTRLFSKALRQLMENADQVFVMGHKYPDMDSIGASMGIIRCALSVGCNPYLVLDEENAMIEGVLRAMRDNKIYQGMIRTPEQSLAMMRSGAVLVVVDTQRENSVMSFELYEAASKTVIIDHHRRPVDSLQNPTLTYLEAGSSSVCEMVTEVLQYFDDSLRPTALECGALLAGITLDTKRFAFNTGARTFEAASYLRRNGADNSAVNTMFDDDMQTFKDRSNVVQNAEVFEGGIALSVCEEGIKNSALVAAQAADELIRLKGIHASFVMAHGEDAIMISGRSRGDINVQLILERIGGGGHLTVAGAQMRNMSITEAHEKLKESILTYTKEVVNI